MLDFFMQVQEPAGSGGGAGGAGAYNSEEYNFPATPTHLITTGHSSTTSPSGIEIYDISGGTFSLTASYYHSGKEYYVGAPSKGQKKLVVKDGYAYSANYISAGYGITVTDVSDPTTLNASTLLATFPIPSSDSPAALFAHPTKDVLWVSTWQKNIYTIDISNPASPSLIGSLALTATGTLQDMFYSPDGEYAWAWQSGVTAFECYQCELDASNNPSNETVINIQSLFGGTASTRDNLMFAISPRTGDNYWIRSERDFNNVGVYHLGGDYYPDSYVNTNDPTNFDFIRDASRALNYVTNYDPSADLAYVYNEYDDYALQIATYTGTTWTNQATYFYPAHRFYFSMDVYDNIIIIGGSINRDIMMLEWSALNTLTQIANATTGYQYSVSETTLYAP